MVQLYALRGGQAGASDNHPLRRTGRGAKPRTPMHSVTVRRIIGACVGLFVASSSALAVTTTTASNNAYNWLVSQMSSGGLITSYQGGTLGYTYDESVAAIAFTLKGDTARAKTILATLQTLQNSSGSFYNSYSIRTLRGSDVTQNVGPNMWVALAVAKYGKATGDHSFDGMATAVLNWALQFQQSDGGFNGGLASNGTVLTWASTEHNEDAYAAYTYFGNTTVASKVKSFLDNVVWDATNSRFYTGRGDTSLHSDVNAWGVLALGPSGTHNYAAGLTYNEATMQYTATNTRGTVTGFDFDGSPTNDVWLEGTGQNAEAFLVAGNSTNWSYFVNQIITDQDSKGGVQYSMLGTNNGYFTMSTANCVSSTGWLVIAIAQFNPFQP